MNLTELDNLNVWIQRLGHVNNQRCHLKRQKQDPANSKPGEFNFSGLCGLMATPYVSRAKYFVTFKDSCSGYRVVYFLKHKI